MKTPTIYKHPYPHTTQLLGRLICELEIVCENGGYHWVSEYHSSQELDTYPGEEANCFHMPEEALRNFVDFMLSGGLEDYRWKAE